jgi:LPXTG-site transpeptidase (sortase) family protein
VTTGLEGRPSGSTETPKPGDAGWQVVRHRAGMRRFIILGTALVAVLLLAGGAFALTRHGDQGPPTAAPTGSSPAAPSATDGPLQISAVEASPAAELPPPDRVRIGAIGVDSPLDQLDVDASGKLEPPKTYERAGWFAKGPAPGDIGPAVIAGHVDSVNGPAVFARLGQLKAGDVIEVSRGGSWVRFQVTVVEHYAKADFPTDKVYRPTPVPELRLITCGGTFDHNRKSYVDNYVVYAVELS